jgi:hypothetical protein
MKPSRRSFLKTSSLALGAAALPSWMLDREAAAAAERVGGPGDDAGLFPALKLREFHFTSLSEAV